MGRRRMLGALLTVVALLACDPTNPEPRPGTLQVSLTPADWATAEEISAACLTVRGPEVADLQAVAGLTGYVRSVSGSEIRIAVLGPLDPGPVAIFQVSDVGDPSRYSVVLEQVALMDATLADTAAYRITVEEKP